MLINEINQVLGKPYFQTNSCLIYQLDCLDGMTKIPDELINLTVTSPPYNIGKDYEKNLPIDEYLSWCNMWLSEIYRITLNTGSFWLNLGYLSIPNRAKAIPIPYLIWDKVPLFVVLF